MQVSYAATATEAAVAPLRLSISAFLERVIFPALLAVLVAASIPYGTVTPGWEAIFECAVFALGILWIFQGVLMGAWRWKSITLLAPVAGLALLSFLQVIKVRNLPPVSADPFETGRVVLKLLALVTFGELLSVYTSSPRRLRALVMVIIGIVALSALFGISRQAFPEISSMIFPAGVEPGIGYGQFVNYNHFALLMEMGLGLVAGLLVSGGVASDKATTYLAAATPMAIALLLTTSRGGILSLLCMTFLVVFLYPIVRRRKAAGANSARDGSSLLGSRRAILVRLVLALSLVAVTFAGVLWVGGEPLARRLDAPTTDTNENATRHDIWEATWRLIKDHPVAGVGSGAYFAVIPHYHLASGGAAPQQAHNEYLELLASAGVIGLGLLLWFAFALMRTALGRLRSHDAFRRGACFGALAGLFAVAVHSIVDFGLHITINSLVFMSLAVIATLDQSVDEARPARRARSHSDGATA